MQKGDRQDFAHIKDTQLKGLKMFFSIIVPVHNGQKYLESSVMSALEQEVEFYNDKEPLYEIIIVENGSTDSTASIADRLAESHDSVRVLHIDAVGLYAARQYGIEVASGDYIVALDSDDELDGHLLHRLYDVVKEQADRGHHPDIIYFNVADMDNRQVALFDHPFTDNKLYVGAEKAEFCRLLCQGDSINSMWSKCIKRDIAYLGLKDLYLNYGEDLYQTVQYVDRASEILFIADILYYYRQNDTSITSSYSEVYLTNQKTVWGKVDEEAANWNIPGSTEIISARKALTCTIAVARIIHSAMPLADKKTKLKELMADDFYEKYHALTLPKWAPEENVFFHQLMTEDDAFKALINYAVKFNLKSAVKKVIGRK